MNRQLPPRDGALLHPATAALLACAVIAVLFTAGFLAQHYGIEETVVAAPTDAPTSTAPATPSSSPVPGLGDPARDGNLEFVVSRVNCSGSTVGIEHLKRTAKGKYCVVGLSVRNITTDRSQHFLGHAQKARDTDGNSYRYDEIASIYADQDSQTLVRKLGAGDRMKVKLVFDIPRTTTLTALELHDSLLSGGAEIAVAPIG